MKTISLFTVAVSVFVGLCSILAFFKRTEILELAAKSPLLAHLIPADTIANVNTQHQKSTEGNTSQTSTMAAANTTKLLPRLIRQSFLAIEQSEGAGARVRRSIGTPKLRNFSPFLMLDRESWDLLPSTHHKWRGNN